MDHLLSMEKERAEEAHEKYKKPKKRTSWKMVEVEATEVGICLVLRD